MRRFLLSLPARCWIFPLVTLAIAAGLASQQEFGLWGRPSAAAELQSKLRDDAENKPAPIGEAVLENPYPDRIPLKNFDAGLEWLNVGAPLTAKDLKGKVVLLDFWTYCCINCIHILPDLKYLEKKYPNELVVIGVHSAKFDNEKESGNIRQAIQRYEIEHPVINDANMAIWNQFGIHSWPSFVVIDPEWNSIGKTQSEGQRELLDEVIGKVVAFHRAKGTLNEKPLKFQLERDKAEPTPLRYPGKVLADEPGNRLFISDSNHNRIVVTDLDGKLQSVIGQGDMGRKDGGYAEAQFDHPQGMALVDETLYVADTENHLLRAVDLQSQKVSTLAGTGVQAHFRAAGGAWLKSALSSPWDLTYVKNKLYVAMAGPHQIWVVDFKQKTVKPYAGSGKEDIINGTLHGAAFAQPSGITTDGTSLFVADSEGSAIRKVPLDANHQVVTLAGTSDLPRGASLFAFGDKDGIGNEARLQHPLGVLYHDGLLYVADSYNHKIKKVSLDKKESHTYLGNGKAGNSDSPLEFSEPAGLTVAKDRLYIADTNNHRVRVADLKTSEVKTLEIAGLAAPRHKAAVPAPEAAVKDDAIAVAQQLVKAGDTVPFEFKIKLPAGFKFNPEFPTNVKLRAVGEQTLFAADQLDQKHAIEAPAKGDAYSFTLPQATGAGQGTYLVTLAYGYCKGGPEGLCKFQSITWKVPISVDAKGSKVTLSASAP